MRKPLLLILTNAVLLAALFFLLAQSVFITQRIGQARELKGKVWVQRGGKGEFAPLASRATIVRGDVVRTDKESSAQFRWRDGTRWKLGELTTLTLKKSTVDSVKKNEISQFHLLSGKVWVRGVKTISAGSRFEIQTPQAVVKARDGLWSVKVAADQTHIAVLRGQVEVSTAQGAGTISLQANQKALVNMTGLVSSSHDCKAVFEGDTDFIKPELRVRVQPLPSGDALIRGETEAGNHVRIDGTPVDVLGTGGFLKRVSLTSGRNVWKIESTDRHGETTSATKTLDYTPQK